MFKATISNAKEFKKIVEAMSNVVDEISFEVDEKGLRASAVDPSHVALVSIDIPREAFEEYLADPHEIGVDLGVFKKIMKRAKSEEKLILELDEEKNRLNIILENNATRKFSLSLYDVSSSNVKVPDLNYPNEIVIKAGAFKEALKDAELVNDHVTLQTDGEGRFIVLSKGDVNQCETIFDESSEAVLDMRITEPVKSTFSLSYLEDITKAVSSDDILHIHLGSDIPVKIEFNIADGKILFLLAPRIES
ncbi:MAG TPA: DNA polymerase sliding clamp [Methanothermococcus okinawensis]|uniref:DNA polymerase sliding clamp n=1 Tax=Methanofervidicoccus abyssi TaxID=2082189 RepID=A0A401HNL2_9EURY|nr:DNA polymerase sliding clamp [Methanofervidicoccus abyssi]GBF35844.1 proliferating cell nuclear antigen [Methanofervidicoccus abyssi]HIP16316.1 DNA polymerase sliding clamp [Methanothermococcus okinawensis]